MTTRIATLGLFLILLISCKSKSLPHVSATRMRYSGENWLAWDQERRDAFVVAYVDGYKSGAGDACLATDGKLDLRADYIPDHDAKTIVTPSGVCRVNGGHYSACDAVSWKHQVCTAYQDTITAFYAKHPEYRNIPVEYLMHYLSDERHKTADELYSMAKYGEMRTGWQ